MLQSLSGMSQNSQKQVFESYKFASSKLLTPFQRKSLQKSLQGDLDAEYRRRIEIMLLADMGKSQSQICRMLGCSRQMARYWIAIAKAGVAHKWDEPPIGRPKTVNQEYIRRLQELALQSPREYGYGFNSWTAHWLSKHLAKELDIEVSVRHINRLLAQMGLSKRQKREAEQQTNNCDRDTSITISDLPATWEHDFNWSLNLLQINNQLVPINS